MVSFLWPWILALLPVPWLLNRWNPKLTAEDGVEVPPLLARTLASEHATTKPNTGISRFLWLLIWSSLVIACAQPQWVSGEQLQNASGRNLMLVMDLSGSMERKDFVLNGKTHNRLQAVKTIAGDFIVQRQGDRLGLVLFGDEAFVASPLSFDLTATRHALEESDIGMAGRTTALGNALGLALVKLHQNPAPEQAVILLTDGSNNAGNTNPLDAAKLAAQWNIRVHTIGLGSQRPEGDVSFQDPSAELDTTTLKTIANKSGGKYFRADTTQSLRAIYAELDQLESSEHQTPPLQIRNDIRHYFLITALLGVLTLISRQFLPGARQA